MKKFLTVLIISILVFAFTESANAQLTGIKTIPGDYATIAAAVTDLNAQGVGAAGVTFNVAGGYTESITSPILITATGTVANPIIFQKSGAGANPVITRTDGGTLATSTLGGQGDAVIIIQGSDYITFDRIDVSASDAGAGIEYGYYLRKASATDGCKYVSITNSVITMIKGTSAYVIGIYSSNNDAASLVSSSTGITVTSTGGRNEYITITGNTVQNVHVGMFIRGFNASSPYDFYDQNITIGSAGAGNTIQNFGGGNSGSTFGIYIFYQNNIKVAYNEFNNTAGGGTSAIGFIYGIMFGVSQNSNIDIYENNINLTSAGTTGTAYGISASVSGTDNTVNIYNNTVTINYPTATSAPLFAIQGSAASYNLNIYNNTITNCQLGSGAATATGQFSGIYISGSNTTPGSHGKVYNNTISNNSRVQSTPGAGNTYLIYNTSSGLTLDIYNNTINNNNFTSTGTVSAIYMSNSSSTVRNVYGNTISNLTCGGTAHGIYNALGNKANIYKNNIFNINNTSSTGVTYGITSASGLNTYIYNNFISDLKASSATADNAVIGINITNTTEFTNIGLYYNTIFLNATGSGDFGSSGVYHTYNAVSTTGALDMRNNIIINNSTPAGTGKTAAFRRSASTDLNNYLTLSNNNNYYAGTPSASRLIYYNGSAGDQTIADYKTRVSPRDGNSFSENPPFENISAAPYNLHLQTTTPTQCESGGVVVSSPIAITDDFEANVRNVTTPDVGADEFSGMPIDLSAPNIVYSALSNTFDLSARTLIATITDPSGVPGTDSGMPRLYWKINGGSYTAVTPSPVVGNQYQYSFGSGVAAGDVVSYYIVARDNAGTPNVGAYPSGGASGFTYDPPAAGTPPTTPSSYTVLSSYSGTFNVGAGQTFTTLSSAINDYNSKVQSGPVTFILMDATYTTPSETFPIVINQNEGASATNTLTIKPNTGVTSTITGSSTDAIIKLYDADYVIIDGSNSGGTDRSLTVENTSTDVNTACIWVASLGVGHGSTNNTIKNCNIKAGSNAFGIYCAGTTISTSGTGADNNYLTLQNNSISKSYYGIFSRGVASTGLLNGLNITGNLIGSNTPADFVTFRGIDIQNAAAPNVSQNEIFNLQISTNVNNAGIEIGQYVTDATVSRNKIYGLKSLSTIGMGSYGINISSGTGTSNVQISNNLIYDIITDGNSVSVTSNNPFGIRIIGGTNHKIYYNTVNMYGSFTDVTTADMSAALIITNATATGIDVRNNIFANSMTGGAGTKCYSIYVPTGTTFGTINNNDYYASGTNGVLGYYGADKTTLGDWVFASGGDANSKSINPEFFSNTDLRPALGSGVLGAGATGTGITIDYLGTARSLTSPSMGAYEDGTAVPAKTLSSITYNQASTGTCSQGSGNQEILRLDFDVTGNSGSLLLNSIVVKSENTSDADVTNVKLYGTTSTAFSTANQLGTTAAFSGGNATFSSLAYDLPSGTSYIWIAYDISASATLGNFLDAKILPNQINVAGTLYPAAEQSPAGNRLIKNVISIGTGTSIGYFPFDPSVGYVRSASLYTSAEIGNNLEITKLKWNVASSSATVIPIKIYAKHTSASTVSADTWANTISGASLLYDGTYTFNSTGWNSVTLTNSFIYDNSAGNILILCESNYGGIGSSSYPTYYYTDPGSNKHAYVDNNNTPPNGNLIPGVYRPNIQIEFGIPSVMTYTSSTSTQNTISLIPNTLNQQIIGIEIVTSGLSTPFTVSGITVNANGTTNINDISNAKVFYTGTSPAFALTSQFGSTIASPTVANFDITGTQILTNGTNYFWLTFDIKNTAVIGNYVDAECIKITGNGTMGERTPTVTVPAGSRMIKGALSGTYAIGTGLFNRITGKNLYPVELTRKVKVLVQEENPFEDVKQKIDAGNTEKVKSNEKTDIEYKEIEAEEKYTVMYENGKPYEGIMKVTGSPAKSENTKTSSNLIMSPDSYTEVFADIPTAISELNIRGVSGPVIFEFTEASYSTSGFALNAVTGASATNTITFRPQSGETVEISGSSATALVDLSGCRYVVFDGSNSGTTSKDLTISNTNTLGSTIRFINDASNCIIKNSVIKGVNPSSNSGVVFFSTAATNGCDNNIIDNNSITNGSTYPYYCMYFNGTSGKIGDDNDITNNIITNFSYSGIYIRNYYSGSLISGNDIYEINPQSSSPIVGIYILSGGQLLDVTKNKIHDLNTVSAAAIYGIVYFAGYSGDVLNINNNIIYLDGGLPTNSTIIGFYASADNGTTTNFNYNSVYIGGSSITGNTSTVVKADYYCPVSFKNNVFYNARSNSSGTEKHYIIRKEYASWTFTSDYNDYYVSGTGGVLFNNMGVDITTLDGWRAAFSGQDNNTLSSNPGFTSTTNLIPNTSNPNSWSLSGNGIHIGSVTTDFTGASRPNGVINGAPDIGAYEFGTPTVDPNEITTSVSSGSNDIYVYGRKLLNLNFVTLGGIGNVGVKFFSGAEPPGATGGAKFMNGYFKITQTGGSGYKYDITYYYSETQLGTITSEANLRLSKSDDDGAHWTVYTNPGTGDEQYVLNTEANTIKVNGLTSFSIFANTDNDAPLPVELSSFTSSVKGRNVKLSWVTATEQNNAGFDVERKTLTSSWTKVGFLQGKGTVNTPTNYTFEDKNLNAGKYNYRLKQIDINGNFTYHNLNTDLEVALPKKYDLSQNYPNPFNPTTKIDFALPLDSKVSVVLYDITGREVKRLLNNEQRSAGYYTVDFNGSSLSSGTYFYRFIAESTDKQTVITKKMMLVK